MFLGNKDTQKAAAQQVIEAGAHISKAASALRILSNALPKDESLKVVESARKGLLELEDSLAELFSDDCRAAFTEE